MAGSVFKDHLFWGAFIIGSFILSLTLWFGIGVDSATIGYCAWVWKHYGLPPYVGCIEGDYPGIFLIQRLQMELFGEGVMGFRLFNFGLQLGALVMVFYLARRFAESSLAGLLAVIFYALYYYQLDYYYTGEREEYVLWLIFLSLVASLVFSSRRFLRSGLVGLMVGFAFLIKPTFGLLWPLFGVWFIWEGWKRGLKSLGLELGLFVVCCVLPALLVISYYCYLGYLWELYDVPVWMIFKAYIRKPLLYSVHPFDEVTELTQAALLRIQLRELLTRKPVYLAGAVLAAGLELAWPRPGEHRKILALLAALVLAGFLSIYLQRGVWGYHQIPFWGICIILSGAGYGRLLEQIRGGRLFSIRLLPVVLLSLFLFALVIWQMPWYLRKTAYKNFRKSPERVYFLEYQDALLTADYLKSELGEEEEYFYFGSISNVPFLAGHKLSTPFPFSEPFFWRMKDGSENPVKARWQKPYEESVVRGKPRIFVYNTATPIAVFYPQVKDFKAKVREEMPVLQEALDNHYHLVKIYGKIEIYERNH